MRNAILTFFISMVVLAVLVTAHFQASSYAQESVISDMSDLPTVEDVLPEDKSTNLGSFVFGFSGGVTVGALVLYIHLRKDSSQENRKKSKKKK